MNTPHLMPLICKLGKGLVVAWLLSCSVAILAQTPSEEPAQSAPPALEVTTPTDPDTVALQPVAVVDEEAIGTAVSSIDGAPQRPDARYTVQARRPAASDQAAIEPAVNLTAPLRIVLGLTVLAVLPALLVCLTSFLRIVIVLSMLRHAIGMPETPPNTVLIGMSLFLTLFTMSPVMESLNRDAVQPFLQGKLGIEATYDRVSKPLRTFMIRQTREQDLALMVEISKAPRPRTMDDISNVQLIPAFMLSELRAAFQIGFVIFLPFLLIDLIISSMLMALGMMMMPPITVALPVKVLMFVLVDGWSLILRALVGSFH